MKPGYSLQGHLILSVATGLILCLCCGCGCWSKKEEVVQLSVSIESVPEPGASVLMAGDDQGQTPVTIYGLQPGQYEVIMNLDKYKRKIETITVTQDAEQKFTIAMEPIIGDVSISSTPEADVFLNGELIGKTPILKKVLQVGSYSYEIKHPDYYPVKKDFLMEENFKLEFEHELRPLESQLTVTSRPSSANIWLNNIAQAQRTPASIVLRPGRYLVSVHSEGFVQADSMVVLEANAPQTVNLEMSPGKVPQGMVLIPAGPFTMGSNEHAPDERPAREITLPAFYIDRFEVTNQAYKNVVSSHTYPKGQDNFPAMGISWTQALRYCDAIGKRLPTEAEWEKAARGSDKRIYPWGDIFSPQMSNTKETGLDMPTRVGYFYATPSANGCIDTAGNAYEWVMDWYDAYPGNHDITKDYGQIFRILRGGSYLTEKFEARTSARHFDRMDSGRRDYGFRCAMDERE